MSLLSLLINAPLPNKIINDFYFKTNLTETNSSVFTEIDCWIVLFKSSFVFLTSGMV